MSHGLPTSCGIAGLALLTARCLERRSPTRAIRTSLRPRRANRPFEHRQSPCSPAQSPPRLHGDRLDALRPTPQHRQRRCTVLVRALPSVDLSSPGTSMIEPERDQQRVGVRCGRRTIAREVRSCRPTLADRSAPGTANTSMPRSAASRAVIRLPPRSRLSTTTTSSDSAARILLRCGNRYGSGRTPGGHSEMTAPRSATSAHSERHGVSDRARSWPFATTATGGAPDDRDAPRWAAPSTPSASPDTTTTPASASSCPNRAAV